jgi:hypothetical protein
VHIEEEVRLKVGLKPINTHQSLEVDALLYSGATGLFLNYKLVNKHHLIMQKLVDPVKVYNIDGMENEGGSITKELTHEGHQERAVFKVCNLRKSNVILGYLWLRKHNPEVD